MKKLPFVLMFVFISLSFILNFFALMKMFPLYISSPLLFLSILILIITINDRKKFKGF
ncbi:hypothetical protein V7122_24760 [Bacillus sp. JJ1532]